MFFSLTAHGENLEAGAVFIDYFTNSVEANEVLAAERGVPVSTAVADAIKPNMEPAAVATFDFLASLEVSPILPPDPIAHGDIQTNVYEPLVIDPLMYGQIGPEEAVALFIEQANNILAGQDVSLSTAPVETAAAEAPLATGEFQLQWWGSQNRHERTIATVELFIEQNPDVEVPYEFVGWGDYWTSLATKAAGGNLPDVIQQDYARFFQFQQDGLIIPLDPYVESGLIDLSNVPEEAIAGGMIDGELYALSLGTNSQSFVLDLDVFEEAGLELPAPDWTWADFEEIAMAIHENTGKYGVVGGLANPQIVNALYLSLGEGLYNSDGTALGFSDKQPLVDYFSMMVRLQDAGAMVSREEEVANPTNLENNAFVTGDAGMFFAHTNQFVALYTSAGEDRNLMMVPVPRAVGATQSANYLKPSMFFSLTSHGTNLEAGALFINFFTNSVEANEILAAERGVPVSTAVADAIKPSMSPAAAATFDFLANLEVSPILPPDPVAHGDIQTNVYEPLVIDPLMYGQITPEEAVDTFIEEANAILAAQ
jgi:multiple sugar transport system substrate-binding protein